MKFREIRHTYPKKLNRVLVPNSPRKPEPVRLALKLQTKTMQQLCKIGRRLIKKILMSKSVDNNTALAYYGSRFKQVSAEHKFRITKKTP